MVAQRFAHSDEQPFLFATSYREITIGGPRVEAALPWVRVCRLSATAEQLLRCLVALCTPDNLARVLFDCSRNLPSLGRVCGQVAPVVKQPTHVPDVFACHRPYPEILVPLPHLWPMRRPSVPRFSLEHSRGWCEEPRAAAAAPRRHCEGQRPVAEGAEATLGII